MTDVLMEEMRTGGCSGREEGVRGREGEGRAGCAVGRIRENEERKLTQVMEWAMEDRRNRMASGDCRAVT
jgi:hypothetical protein